MNIETDISMLITSGFLLPVCCGIAEWQGRSIAATIFSRSSHLGLDSRGVVIVEAMEPGGVAGRRPYGKCRSKETGNEVLDSFTKDLAGKWERAGKAR